MPAPIVSYTPLFDPMHLGGVTLQMPASGLEVPDGGMLTFHIWVNTPFGASTSVDSLTVVNTTRCM